MVHDADGLPNVNVERVEPGAVEKLDPGRAAGARQPAVVADLLVGRELGVDLLVAEGAVVAEEAPVLGPAQGAHGVVAYLALELVVVQRCLRSTFTQGSFSNTIIYVIGEFFDTF